MSRSIPPQLEAYLEPLHHDSSDGYLTCATHVLGASSNWLVLRFLLAFLATDEGRRGAPVHSPRRGADRTTTEADGGRDEAVVLVSFLRDYAFWRENAGRLGLDLNLAQGKSRFAFVDGCTSLSLPPSSSSSSTTASEFCLTSPTDISQFQRTVEKAIHKVSTGNKRVLLILDAPDTFQSLHDPADGPTSVALQESILTLREKSHATLLTLAVDDALLHGPGDAATPLDRQQNALVWSQLHAAHLVLSLRTLDTGAAADVSGVLRITRGGSGMTTAETTAKTGRSQQQQQRTLDECEYLYHVGADGGAKIFQRG